MTKCIKHCLAANFIIAILILVLAGCGGGNGASTVTVTGTITPLLGITGRVDLCTSSDIGDYQPTGYFAMTDKTGSSFSISNVVPGYYIAVYKDSQGKPFASSEWIPQRVSFNSINVFDIKIYTLPLPPDR